MIMHLIIIQKVKFQSLLILLVSQSEWAAISVVIVWTILALEHYLLRRAIRMNKNGKLQIQDNVKLFHYGDLLNCLNQFLSVINSKVKVFDFRRLNAIKLVKKIFASF